EILVGLDRVAFAFLNVVGAKLTVDQVLGLTGFKQVVIGDVVVAHAITDHVDDVFRASGLLRRCRSHNGSRNSQTSSDSSSGAKNARENRNVVFLETLRMNVNNDIRMRVG